METEKPLDLISEETNGTEDTYHLNNVEVIELNHINYEIADGKSHETKSIILVPNPEYTETQRFFNAWLPSYYRMCLKCNEMGIRSHQRECPNCGSDEIHEDRTEMAGKFTGPTIYDTTLLGCQRRNDLVPQHHLWVMSTGVEVDLRPYVGKKLNIKILPGTEIHKADGAKSIQRTAKDI